MCRKARSWPATSLTDWSGVARNQFLAEHDFDRVPVRLPAALQRVGVRSTARARSPHGSERMEICRGRCATCHAAAARPARSGVPVECPRQTVRAPLSRVRGLRVPAMGVRTMEGTRRLPLGSVAAVSGSVADFREPPLTSSCMRTTRLLAASRFVSGIQTVCVACPRPVCSGAWTGWLVCIPDALPVARPFGRQGPRR